MKYHSKILVFNICHTEIIICIRKFTVVNILGGITFQEISTTTSTYKVLIKFWQSINEELLKIKYLITPPNILEALVKNFLLCDFMTAFARFPKYWLNLLRYSTLRSPLFMLSDKNRLAFCFTE